MVAPTYHKSERINPGPDKRKKAYASSAIGTNDVTQEEKACDDISVCLWIINFVIIFLKISQF
jgi:hypothetical protein